MNFVLCGHEYSCIEKLYDYARTKFAIIFRRFEHRLLGDSKMNIKNKILFVTEWQRDLLITKLVFREPIKGGKGFKS